MLNKSSSSSSWELGKNGKRRRAMEDASTADRLSHLPESIIHHILSFLDTKSAVQTAVLSRVWQCAWKHVPFLDFRSDSFQRCSSFRRYVESVLSLRHPLNVREVSFTYCGDDDDEEREVSLLVKVIGYALSHDAQRLVIDLGDTLKMEEKYRFSDLFGTISNSNLKFLKLGGVYIDSGFGSSGFSVLTTLYLKRCELDSDGDSDPFSGFPQLKDLFLVGCLHLALNGKTLIISGPELLSLMLYRVFSFDVKLLAPKLRFFSLNYYEPSLEFSESSLPSLDLAEIWFDLVPGFTKRDMDWLQRHLSSLFKALHNAKCLVLHSEAIKVLSEFSEVLEQQSSPFTRLKRLKLYSNSITYRLVNYFLEGSASIEPTIEFV